MCTFIYILAVHPKLYILRFNYIAGEFGIVYRARLTGHTLRKTDCEIVAVKTVKGKDVIEP